jgi:putative nucleotidyltransferase with HDIG domain
MSVYWTINGVAACRSPLCNLVEPATRCAHADHNDQQLHEDLAAFRRTWGKDDNLEIHEGPCDQQDHVCHCEEQCDCDWSLPPEVEQELERQQRRANIYRFWNALEKLAETGTCDSIDLDTMVPELRSLRGCEQGNLHALDVWGHTVAVVRGLRTLDSAILLAGLLHDIGKPEVQEPRDDGEGFKFHRHDAVGAEIAERIVQRLEMRPERGEKVVSLVRHHMRLLAEPATPKAYRRMLKDVGRDNLEDLFRLRRADIDSDTPEDKRREWNELATVVEQGIADVLAEDAKPKAKDMVLSGKDVMQILDLQPGPEVGKAIGVLFKWASEDWSERNNEAALRSRLEEMKQ